MQNLGRPVGRGSAQGPFSDFSSQPAEEQGQITGSNDEDVKMTGGDDRPSRLGSNLESDFEIVSPEAQAAISRVSYGRPTATLTPAKSKKRPSAPRNLLKELAPFNQDSIVKADPGIPGLNLRDAHNTRGFVRTLNTITTSSNTPILPLDTLNPHRQEDEQPRATRSNRNNLRSTKNARSPKSKKIQEDFHGGPTTRVRDLPKASEARTAEDTVREEAKRQRRLKAEGKKAWTVWRARKHQIVDLIRAPSFPHSEDTDGPTRKKLGSMGPDGFNMFMEDDFYVLAPTAAELWDLPTFIAKVENITGRKRGFVKIVLPNEMKSNYCPPHPTATTSSTDELLFNESSSSIRPYQTKLDLHKPFEPGMVIYRVAMLGAVNVLISEWQEAMQKYQQEIMKRESEKQLHVRDMYNQLLSTLPNEKEMIADSERASDDMYYTTDIQESPSLRQALQLGGPYLRSIHGNRLQEPRFKELEMNRPQIQVVGAKGSPFGLEMMDHAAYSLNYLHRGAPKRWVIIEPDAHLQLEELLQPEVEFVAERLVKKSRTEFKPPTHPPRCDRFLGHQPLYVPKDILALHGIAHTELVQYEGEMVVTFPFTYYQGISAGPSVAEVMAFGNDRWETIHKSRLYQSCHANCSGPKVPENAGQVGQAFPGHIGGHIGGYVPEPGLEEDDEVSSGIDARSETGSETEDGNGEGSSVNDGITSQNPATEASATTNNAVAGFKSDEMSEDESLM